MLTGRRTEACARTRWTIVALAVIAGIAVGFAVGKVPPAMAMISTDFGLDKVTAGWLASIFFAFGAGFGVLTGMDWTFANVPGLESFANWPPHPRACQFGRRGGDWRWNATRDACR